MKKKQKIMNIVFAGTPAFAVPFLEALAGREDVTAVITRPDRPAGRKRIITPPPVKVAAGKKNIEVFQPENINSPESARTISRMRPDLIVTVSYGAILGKQVLGIPRFGCVNIHPSLLPRYRGPCPVERALMNGEEVTGVCCILMDEGMDTGPIISRGDTGISPADTKASLEKKLAETGIRVLRDCITRIRECRCRPEPQEGEPVYAPFISKEETVIDWTDPAARIHDLIRALNPAPGARTAGAGRKMIIWESVPARGGGKPGRPGEIIKIERDRALVAAGEGVLCIKTVQPEGGRKQNIADFLRGRDLESLG